MEVILRLEVDKKEFEDNLGEKVSEDKLKEYLAGSLFEICEEWVLRGQQPDLEFVE